MSNSPQAGRSGTASEAVRRASRLYERALLAENRWRKSAKTGWAWAGCLGILAAAWYEPLSQALLEGAARALGAALGLPGLEGAARWGGAPALAVIRAVLLVESFGYLYHRFFQHVGWLTRRAQLIRRNQMYHWVHHMIIYPIGRGYRRDMPYVTAEDGGWSWVVPGLLAAGGVVATNGPTLATGVLLAATYAYAQHAVDLTHDRFHETRHPWTGKPYFRWIEDIHVLHHWDQRTNFTIVHPLFDMIFGTYLSPERHRREIREALEDRELTVSDLINWRYLLIEATPAEYAAFICQARRHPRSLRKLGRLLEVLRLRREAAPSDVAAAELLRRALRLEGLVGPSPAAVPPGPAASASA